MLLFGEGVNYNLDDEFIFTLPSLILFIRIKSTFPKTGKDLFLYIKLVYKF